MRKRKKERKNKGKKMFFIMQMFHGKRVTGVIAQKLVDFPTSLKQENV